MDWIDETMKRLPHEILDTIGRSGEEQTFRLLRGDAAPIGRLEEEIGCALPGDYREFVRRYGGASLDDCVMLPATDHPELDDMVSVSNFFGLYDGNAAEHCPQDVRYHYHSHHGLLPPGMAPIAGSGDNVFLLACAGDDRGSVFLWMPPEFEDDEPEIVPPLLPTAP